MKINIGGRDFEVTLTGDHVEVDGKAFTVSTQWDGSVPIVKVDNLPFRVELPEERSGEMTVTIDHRPVPVSATGTPSVRRPKRSSQKRSAAPAAVTKGAVTASMTGEIVEVHVKVGDSVKEGDVIGILEAMKMKNDITAPSSGTVKSVAVEPGSRVNQGDVIVVLDDAS